ncbi:MAG: HAMP domain-containing histidine kinase [Chitinophagaceae bacterium]|nr:HAMP domain-containing histidine kinase [Chitinophagaceae bacterium]
MKRNKKNSTFRFPFDIDQRIFLVLAAIFFILAIYPVQKRLFPGYNQKTIVKLIEKDLDKRIKHFNAFSENEQNLIANLYNQKASAEEIHQFMKLPYSVWLYERDSLIAWNDHSTTPLMPLTAGMICRKDFHGYLLQYTMNVDSIRSLIAVFYVKYESNNENENLRNHFFAGDPDNDFGYAVSLTPVSGSRPVYINNEPKFYIFKKDDYQANLDGNEWRLFFSAVPFILFGVSIHTYFKVAIKRKNIVQIFSMLLITAIGVRALCYLFDFPNDFANFQLFSENYLAIDPLNRSLGDTFVNVCLGFWILLFFVMNIQGKVLALKKSKFKIPFVVGMFLMVCTGGIYLSNLTFSIIRDSVIVFDTTLLNQLDLFTFIGLLTFMVIFANFLLLAIIAYNYFQIIFVEKYIKYIFIVIAYILFKLLPVVKYDLCYEYVFISFAGLFLCMDTPSFRIKFDFNSYMLLLWIIIISFAGSYYLVKLIDKKELVIRQQYAEKLLFARDKKTELELQNVVDQIRTDTLWLDSIMHLPEKEMNAILFERYLFRFARRYFVEVQCFNQKSPVSMNRYADPTVASIGDSVIFHQNNNEIQYIAYLNSYPDDQGSRGVKIVLSESMDLYYANENQTGLTNFEKTIRDYNYSTAVYQDSQLVSSYGTYAFDNVIKPSSLFSKGSYFSSNHGIYNEFWYKPSKDDRVVLVVKENFFFTKFVTIFAYFFFIYFIVITLYILGNILARSNLVYKRFLNLMSLNLRLRVHVAILFVVFLSFIAIGYVTSYYLIARYEARTQNEVIRNLATLKEDVSKAVSRLDDSNAADAKNLMIANVSASSARFKYPVNVYDFKNGNLLYSSMTYLNHLDMVADRINPLAFYDIRNSRKEGYTYQEVFHKLKYLSAYTILKDNNGVDYAILQLPFISSDINFRSESRSVLITLVNIYVFVFLISSFIALLITNSVVKPFNYIVKQFTKINLSKTNQPLTWQYSDEIGLLVKEYNRMLRKLENSTVQLAKSEREMAWREMAKQVAHEIKNPLTPMKLSLQMLDKAIKNRKANTEELTIKVTNTLIEQIDNLTLIATNFSNFAKMPELKREVFSLNEVLFSVTGMYNDDSYNEFLFIIPAYEIYVFADKSQLIRVFTNILQNAIQAIPETRKGNISLTVSKAKDNYVCLSITDNGEGITPEMGKKLFEPYFTTKSSGTGLGLAMCKDIIEQFGGKIKYESELNKETTFHIYLPIFELDEEKVMSEEEGYS